MNTTDTFPALFLFNLCSKAKLVPGTDRIRYVEQNWKLEDEQYRYNVFCVSRRRGELEQTDRLKKREKQRTPSSVIHGKMFFLNKLLSVPLSFIS